MFCGRASHVAPCYDGLLILQMHQIGPAFYSPLYPIALSNLQGEAMINQRITFFTDDDALVDII